MQKIKEVLEDSIQQEFEEDFIEMNDEKLVENRIVPLTEDQIMQLTKPATSPDIEYPLKTQKCVFFDKMPGIYFPTICRDQFYYLVIKKQWRYIIFKLDPEEHNSVYIEKCGLRDSTYDDFLQSINPEEPRWIIYDFEMNVKEFGVDSIKTKMVFIIYSPDCCSDSKAKTVITFKKDMLLS